MSDWLQQLSELESKATPVEWFRDGTNLDALPPDAEDQHDERRYIAEWLAPEDADFIAALRNSAQHLIERARRAEELERENESRYSDREAFLADANLMIQEKTRIMHEVQQLTTQMPPAALKFMGYALIGAGRNP